MEEIAFRYGIIAHKSVGNPHILKLSQIFTYECEFPVVRARTIHSDSAKNGQIWQKQRGNEVREAVRAGETGQTMRFPPRPFLPFMIQRE